jgi:hypothetical protein
MMRALIAAAVRSIKVAREPQGLAPAETAPAPALNLPGRRRD